jgi:hypothetical protein
MSIETVEAVQFDLPTKGVLASQHTKDQRQAIYIDEPYNVQVNLGCATVTIHRPRPQDKPKPPQTFENDGTFRAKRRQAEFEAVYLPQVPTNFRLVRVTKEWAERCARVLQEKDKIESELRQLERSDFRSVVGV